MEYLTFRDKSVEFLGTVWIPVTRRTGRLIRVFEVLSFLTQWRTSDK